MGNGEKLLNGYSFAFGADEKLLELEKKSNCFSSALKRNKLILFVM